MKQKLLILVSANWPTLPVKVNDLKGTFPEIDLSIDAKETRFATVPFRWLKRKTKTQRPWDSATTIPAV
jgi:hypothetical protein